MGCLDIPDFLETQRLWTLDECFVFDVERFEILDVLETHRCWNFDAWFEDDSIGIGCPKEIDIELRDLPGPSLTYERVVDDKRVTAWQLQIIEALIKSSHHH